MKRAPEWYYCDAPVRDRTKRLTDRGAYVVCGTWTELADLCYRCDSDGRYAACPVCGGMVDGAERCAFIHPDGDQCEGIADAAYSMCDAHLHHDEDWQADQAEHVCDDGCRSDGCPR